MCKIEIGKTKNSIAIVVYNNYLFSNAKARGYISLPPPIPFQAINSTTLVKPNCFFV